MTGRRIKIPGYSLDAKTGKLVRKPIYRDVSARITAKKKPKTRIARGPRQ